jgi:hypothetical protein
MEVFPVDHRAPGPPLPPPPPPPQAACTYLSFCSRRDHGRRVRFIAPPPLLYN